MTLETDVLKSECQPAASVPDANLLLLPLPGDLPAELTLSPEGRAQMTRSLDAFHAALHITDPHDRAHAVTALHRALPPVQTQTAHVDDTKIPAKPHEVVDFDRCFNVARVASNAPAQLLLRGLLHTAAAILDLAAQAPDLPPDRVAQQTDGFAAYADLLARICQLDVGKSP
ncbi:hypothetical protein [Roseobacter sp.]|uniref:hypothetical protein n=1 Tax=Roseobacter sp. TaxID=1907202 RepID=UPI00329A7CDA